MQTKYSLYKPSLVTTAVNPKTSRLMISAFLFMFLLITSLFFSDKTILLSNKTFTPPISLSMPLSMRTDSKANSYFDVCGAGWNTSDGYLIQRLRQPAQTAVPKFTTTQKTIVIHYTKSGGGSITQTLLSGTGGTYYLGEGTFQIEPGTYTNQIAIGFVTNTGEIHSYVCYK